MAEALTSVLVPSLTKVASGKVRDLYSIDDKTLLFVASDRISAYDVILATGIAHKGIILTQISAFWFALLSEKLPQLKHHLLSLQPPPSITPSLSEAEKSTLRGRSMVVRRLKIFPVEAIVRGYLAGSAYKEYLATGTMHGTPLPAGMQQCAKLPRPVYTPSTKAEQGLHDENISREKAAEIIGSAAQAQRIEELSLAVYAAAAEHAASRGIILADTKFEWGLDEDTGEIVLVDEVLTPDSSRFWPADRYAEGRDQESFDKQFVRNWLTEQGLKGKDGVGVPPEIATATSERYQEAFRLLTGKDVNAALEEQERV